MKKIVKLTEADLYRIVKRVINEQFATISKEKFGSFGPKSAGPNETINFNQTVQLLSKKNGEYLESFYVKTITTRGGTLLLDGTDSLTKTPRKMIYHCSTKDLADAIEYDDTLPEQKKAVFIYKFGPQMQTKVGEMCKKSMGIASTQKPGNTSSVA